MMLSTRSILVSIALTVSAMGPVTAATSSTVPVGAVVSPECVISATPLAFGPYDTVGANRFADLDGTATVVVACTKGMVATVALDLGTNADGSTRRMASGGEHLAYELFRDSSRTDVWGDDLLGRALTLGVSTSKAPQHLTVYGRVAAGQDVPVGQYLDAILVTVNF